MKRYLYLDLVLIAIVALAGHSQAHIGGLVFPIYEIPADHVLNLHEGSLQEWASFAPNSSFNIDNLASPIWGIVGDRGINVADFNVEVYLGWSRDSQKIYVGIQRMDDFYIGSCEDLDDADAIWGYDAYYQSLSGQARIREDADTFVDFLLLPCEGCGETAVQRDVWGRIKVSFR